jgi:hypothetical protein
LQNCREKLEEINKNHPLVAEICVKLTEVRINGLEEFTKRKDMLEKAKKIYDVQFGNSNSYSKLVE